MIWETYDWASKEQFIDPVFDPMSFEFKMKSTRNNMDTVEEAFTINVIFD